MFEMKLYQTGVTEIRGKILNPLGINFYWRGLKNPFLHLKLYVGWFTFHWRDSYILFVLDGIQIFFLCLEGFRYSSCAQRDSDILLVLGGIQIFFLCSEEFRYSSCVSCLSRGFKIPLEGIRYLSRGLDSTRGIQIYILGSKIPLEGLEYPSRGFIIPLEGFRYLSRGFMIPL